MNSENGVAAAQAELAGGARLGQPARRYGRGYDGDRAHHAGVHPASHNATSAAGLLASIPAAADDRLPRNEFLAQLRREKRRVERTHASLSVVLYRMDAIATDEVDDLLERLHQLKRETDLIGHLGDGKVAVLCPDTTAEGAQAFVRKIDTDGQVLGASVVTATYPDHISISSRTRGFPTLSCPMSSSRIHPAPPNRTTS
jgi:hypothetical protein